jgi:hypothetical protein
VATSALGNFVTSITQQDFLPVVVDNFYTGNALFMRLKDKRKTWSSGYQMKIPTEVLGRTALGSYSGGDLFDTNQEDVRQDFLINPAQYYANLTITGIQRAANRGERAIVDLLSAEFSSVGTALQQLMGTDLYGNGTGNSNKALTGLLAQVDDGSGVNVFQNLSRTTYPTLKSTVNTQSGALGLDDLATDWDGAQIGNDHPTLGLTTPSVFSIVDALYTATSRYQLVQDVGRVTLTASGIVNAGVQGNVGFTGIMFRGMPIISDDKCPTGTLYFLNENYLDMYEMAPDANFVAGTQEGFGWTGWKKPTNQDVIVSQLLWYGQLIGTQPRKNSRRDSITS